MVTNVVQPSLKTTNSKNILLHALDYPKINSEPRFSLATASILEKMKSVDLNIEAKTWTVNDTNYSYKMYFY
jgi:hypothetical protein